MRLKVLISLVVIVVLFSFSSTRVKPVKKEIQKVVITPSDDRDPLEPYSLVDQGQFD